jgi:CDP-glucose 4,6-dehydratase
MTPSFWKDRRVLLTGHTGFKGAWAATMMAGWGAKVTATALAPETDPNLWSLIRDRICIGEFTADLRDLDQVTFVCRSARPEIVIHMAAQAQVRSGYLDPLGTFASNFMGTANLLEALRGVDEVKAILVVTSDKVYANAEDGTMFAENSALGGSDPYSASKAATELATHSYAHSFFGPRGVAIATARGGNVVGGGDFSSDRLVPDLYRAVRAGLPVELRYPGAYRPWQHVLDCLSGYLAFLEFIYAKPIADPSALNFGPTSEGIITVSELADAIGQRLGSSHSWIQAKGDFPPEKQALRLNAALARRTLGWGPRLDLSSTIEWTADWYARFAQGEDALLLMRQQIADFENRPKTL